MSWTFAEFLILAFLTWIGHFLPLFFFNPDEAYVGRQRPIPPELQKKSLLGFWLMLLCAALAVILVEIAIYETMTPMPQNGVLFALCGGGLIGGGLAPIITGLCAYITGGRFMPTPVYTFHDPRRSRIVGYLRLALGVLFVAWAIRPLLPIF